MHQFTSSKPHRKLVINIAQYDTRSWKAGHLPIDRYFALCFAIVTMVFFVLSMFIGFHVDKLSQDDLEAHTGLRRCTFKHIFEKYCGPTTIIDAHIKLYRLFAFLKQYPVRRSLTSILSVSHPTMSKYIIFLSSVIDELKFVWENRNAMSNRLPHHFANNLIGSIDSFPIKVYRPSDNAKQSLLYNGKYKHHIYKVSVSSC